MKKEGDETCGSHQLPVTIKKRKKKKYGRFAGGYLHHVDYGIQYIINSSVQSAFVGESNVSDTRFSI